MSGPTLAELARERRGLNDAVKLHEQSLERFWPTGRCWFALNIAEGDDPPADRDDGRPNHLSTSASCLESLADRHPASAVLEDQWLEVGQAFATQGLKSPVHTWRSEGAAEVYCRVRALPATINLAPELDGDLGAAARQLLVDAWRTVALETPSYGGIAERALYSDAGELVEEQNPRSPGYPPNAFLTYWGLRALEAYDDRRQREGLLPGLPDDIDVRRRVSRAWASHTLARQTALGLENSEHTDPQQLAYALATDVRWGDPILTAGTARHELYEAALAAFFAQQLPSSAWPRSEPLFHYPESGNAYCYTYETLTELLRPGLPREGGRVFRELLWKYLPKLLDAWHHAQETRVPLDADGTAFGWSSGHHTFRLEPEGWATASVYSFMQMLRCIVGHFAVEAASHEVRIRRPKEAEPDRARELLRTRGRTWAQDAWTVGRQLASMFLHPLGDAAEDPDMRDPDTPLIAPNEARSAILFGPPGTGKTTLVEALAGALGWHFVEVQAADFLSAGIDAVPSRADEIFGALMQLDRCVVLFDEIDELIRRREGQETDPFGRFLTTSMLPKIAHLWEQGRVLFFVATNHVGTADRAIRRSSRFDAAILVAPPGLAAKREELERLLGEPPPEFSDEKVADALRVVDDQELVSAAERPMGVLALLRHDQISELAERVSGNSSNDRLVEALAVLADDLLKNEWRPDGQDDLPDEPNDRLEMLYGVLRGYQDETRRDRSRRHYLVALDGELPRSSTLVRNTTRGTLARVSVDVVAEMQTNSDGRAMTESGAGVHLVDDGLLTFSRAPTPEGGKAPPPG